MYFEFKDVKKKMDTKVAIENYNKAIEDLKNCIDESKKNTKDQ